jgi:carboxypeptidase Q
MQTISAIRRRRVTKLRKAGLFCAAALVVFAALSVLASAQGLPPVQKPFEPKVPQGTYGCSIHKPCADVAPIIIQNALGASALETNLRVLTDEIGGRVTGSPAGEKAIDWAVNAFRQAKVDEVLTENFTLPAGWAEGRTRLTVLSPEPFPVHVVSIGWSPATPEGGLSANVVDIGTGQASDFKSAGDSVKGAILLVHKDVLKTWDDLFNEYLYEPAVVQRAMDAGASAILWMSTRPYLLLYRHIFSMDGTIDRLPQAVVAREDALRMARLIAAGQTVKVNLDMPNKINGQTASENVVAEIRGSEKPEEFVILAAHLDSWELGTGALDNGCNAAMVIDAARAIRASGSIPRRSIRFVLFTGEEQGMLGSWAYALAHRKELDKMDAAVVFDAGDGRVTGYSLGGRKDIAHTVDEALKPLANLGPLENTTDAEIGTDNFDFMLEGVPTLVANQEPDDYMMNYHAFSDTFDKVDFVQLKNNEAIAAVTAYAIADAPDRLGIRQTRSQVERLMKEAGMDKRMKLMGLWEMWADGKRGRQAETQHKD